MKELLDATWLSVQIASVATFVCLLIGVPLAWGMARRRFAGRGLVEALILLPVVLPPTVVGYLLLVTFGAQGPFSRLLRGYSIVFKFEGAVLAAVVVAMPMLYLPTKAAFASVEREMEDVAKLMGASRWQTFWHVSIPLARRGLLSGLVLAFARAFGEFGATIMVYGWRPNKLTLPVSVYARFFDESQPADGGDAVWPAVLVMSVAALALVLVYNTLSAKSD